MEHTNREKAIHAFMSGRINGRVYSRAARIFRAGSFHFMLAMLALCSVSLFTLGEHKYERIRAPRFKYGRSTHDPIHACVEVMSQL
ncbi:hypothetical protein Ptc2401_01048 [Prosthecochloris sp. CIB 2401]|nr:hypothetical protein Ptc2401_01048 [Prosthecochloris sp. CIB 2401]